MKAEPEKEKIVLNNRASLLAVANIRICMNPLARTAPRTGDTQTTTVKYILLSPLPCFAVTYPF